MREIKFRAWVSRHDGGWKFGTGMTYDVSVINQDYLIISYADNGRNTEGDKLVPGINAEFVLMQFTGLKDKNGKEVYEGDILCGNKNIDVDELDNEHTITVQWEVNGWNIGLESEADYTIIGNIYENPELIPA